LDKVAREITVTDDTNLGIVHIKVISLSESRPPSVVTEYAGIDGLPREFSLDAAAQCLFAQASFGG